MILPTDGSKLSFLGVEEGLKVAKRLDTPVVAVFVIKPSSYYQGLVEYDATDVAFSAQQMIKESLEKQGEEVLKRVETKAQELGVKLETKIQEGTPYKVITEMANDDDIIYISSHGHSGLSSLFLGSTTDRVLKHTRSTVAVVRPSSESS